MHPQTLIGTQRLDSNLLDARNGERYGLLEFERGEAIRPADRSRTATPGQSRRATAVNSRSLAILLLLLLCDVSTALAVVYQRHQSRLLAVELGVLEKQQDEGLAEWSRLQIEQGWLADASQIEKTARGALHMQEPAETQLLVIRP